MIPIKQDTESKAHLFRRYVCEHREIRGRRSWGKVGRKSGEEIWGRNLGG